MYKDNISLLMRELNFTQADLDTNRNGYLSDGQKQKLAHQRLWIMAGDVAMLGGAILFFYIGIATLFPPVPHIPAYPDDLISFGITLGICATGGLGLPFALLVLREGWNYDIDAREGELTHIRGILRKSINLKLANRSDGLIAYGIQIGAQQFRVNGGVYQAFEEEHLYHLYYTSKTKTILSAELASDE